MVIFLSILLSLFGFAVAPQALANSTPVLDRTSEVIDLGPNSHYLTTTALYINELTKREDLPWQPVLQSPLNINIDQPGIWLKTDFRTGVLNNWFWVLHVPWSGISSLEWYLYDRSNNRLGQNGSIDQWRIAKTFSADKHPYSVRLMLADNHEYTLFLKVTSEEKLIVPVSLVKEKTFIQQAVENHLMFGLFYGILIAMLGYNLSLFIYVRDSSYAYYCLYVSTIILYTLSVTGIGSAYIWHDFDWLNEHGYRFTASLAFFAAALFIRSFLKLPQQGGWLRLSGDIAVLAWAMVLLQVLIFPTPWQVYLVDGVGTISCIAGFTVSAYRWYQGDISGKYMTIAWSMLIFSTFLLMLGLTGIIAYRTELYYFQFVGFVIEVLLLSMALAERIGRERKERIAAESQSIYYEQQSLMAKSRELAAQQHALAVERQAKEELEQKVEEQTFELKQAMGALEQANHELEHISRVDGLTGLYNRRYFDKAFKDSFSSCLQQQLSLSVLILDVDFFKQVNDKYGYQAGDECLRQIAQILQQNADNEAHGLCARYGGEEFCLVVAGMDATAAAKFAEQIRTQVSSLKLCYGTRPFQVTISIGVATTIPTPQANPEKLLQAADNALYLAKSNGRNRVEQLPF
ncbi:diguanylate cyclase [Maribrevibacterium harenarium]|nr:diguanylate cyclase [Maribrevibacterium harenarium]